MGISAKDAEQLQHNVSKHQIKPSSDSSLFPEIMNPERYNDIVMLLRIRFKEGKAIYLKGNTPSSKNSKEIMQRPTGKSMCCNAPYIKHAAYDYTCTKCKNKCQLGKLPILTNSKVVQTYIENHAQDYIDNRPLFLNLIKDQKKPIRLGVYFIRDSNRRFDVGNACQIITDLAVKHNWLSDDDAKNVTCDFLGYHVDKNSCGVIIKILDSEKYLETLISLI